MTNYEHILRLLTPRKVASILRYNTFFHGAIPEATFAFNKWAKRKCPGCHCGNIWVEGSEEIPNPYLWNKVHVEKTDEWIDYGHGEIVSRVMFLEDEYVTSDWEYSDAK